MRLKFSPLILLLLWLAAAAALALLVWYPVSTRLTRSTELLLCFLLWRGILAWSWERKAARVAVLSVTLVAAGFLLMPERRTNGLREEYVIALSRYEGVPYVWGGEGTAGIDCSGLVRRAMIHARILHSLRHFDGASARHALLLWWHDTSADALGSGYRGLTRTLFETPSLNELDHSRLLPGDLAVTLNGVHIMAYAGGGEWLEADPAAHRVLRVKVPAPGNLWFQTPVRLLRWSALAP